MIEFDYTRLIIETVAACLIYIAVMGIILWVCGQRWLQEYPYEVRTKYLEMHPEVKSWQNKVYVLKLFIKKVIALCIFVASMLVASQTTDYAPMFILENVIWVPVIWLAITVFEVFVFDMGIIGHCKKVRLRDTEEWNEEYRGICKKALLDGVFGILFGIVVYGVVFGVMFAASMLDIKASEARLAKYKEEWGMTSNVFPYVESFVDSRTKSEKMPTLKVKELGGELEETGGYPKEEKEEDAGLQDVNAGRELVRERPVLKGESLWSIAEGIYGDPYKWIELYEVNKNVIGEDAGRLYRGQILQIPEQDDCYDRYFYADYETCYADATQEAFQWEGIEPYIDPDCGYEIQTAMFYYTYPEGQGEQFKICYPRLVAHNGKDVSAINAGIRERAMRMADELLVNRSGELTDSLLHDERYSTEWTRSTVNYVITYLDSDVISVVFQDYMFTGSIYGEDIAMRSYVADINTGIRYKNADLLKNTEDMQLADLIFEDMLAQHEDSEFETKLFNVVLTPQLMAETLQTNMMIDGRHFMNVFLTKDGVGFSLSYRVGQDIDGSYSIMRGWTKSILLKEQVEAYMTDAPVWEYWE